MSDALTPDQIALADLDIDKFLEKVNAPPVDLTKEHFSYPFLNSLVQDVGENFVSDVMTMGPAGSLQEMQRNVFIALKAVYEMGFEGHVIFKTPCTAEHNIED